MYGTRVPAGRWLAEEIEGATSCWSWAWAGYSQQHVWERSTWRGLWCNKGFTLLPCSRGVIEDCINSPEVHTHQLLGYLFIVCHLHRFTAGAYLQTVDCSPIRSQGKYSTLCRWYHLPASAPTTNAKVPKRRIRGWTETGRARQGTAHANGRYSWKHEAQFAQLSCMSMARRISDP